MQIEYTSRFKQSFNDIMNCGSRYYSSNTLKRFYESLKSLKTIILTNPYLGNREPLLKNYEREYRKMIIYNYLKLIYLVEGETIYFVDIWDTRQSPETLEERIQ